MDYTNIHLGMNGDSEKWKLGKFLVKGDRMKNKKKSRFRAFATRAKNAAIPLRRMLNIR